MRRFYKIITHYPLSCLCAIGIWVLCLIPIPETPLDGVALIDKWTHFVFYGGLCAVIWGEYGRNSRGRQQKSQGIVFTRTTLLWLFIAPIIMGGLIELAQAYCTAGNRNGDMMDWAADCVGVVIGQLIGIPLALYLSRRSKG